jgi:transposase
MILKQCVGIDISKEKFNVCFSIIDEEQKVKVKASSKFGNDSKGFEGLILS